MGTTFTTWTCFGEAVNVLDDPAIEDGLLELVAKQHPLVIQGLEEAEARATEDAETLANRVA